MNSRPIHRVTRRQERRAFVLCALLVAVVAWTGRAQEPDQTERWFRDLAHESYEVREAATTGLMLAPDLPDARLSQALTVAVAVPEQRHRLTRVALHRFFSRYPTGVEPPPQPEVRGRPIQEGDTGPGPDTGALGVDLSLKMNHVVYPSQDPTLKHPAIMVAGTLPGFPAYAMLRPGDLILSLDGVAFDDDVDTNRFTETLKQKYKAGQSLTMAVRRGGKVLDVTIVMDSKARLDSVYSTGPRDEAAMLRHAEFNHYLQSLALKPQSVPLQISVPEGDAIGGFEFSNRGGVEISSPKSDGSNSGVRR